MFNLNFFYNLFDVYNGEIVTYGYNYNHTTAVEVFNEFKTYTPDPTYSNVMLTGFALFVWYKLNLIKREIIRDVRKDFENITLHLYDAKMRTLNDIIKLDERSTRKISLIQKELNFPM